MKMPPVRWNMLMMTGAIYQLGKALNKPEEEIAVYRKACHEL